MVSVWCQNGVSIVSGWCQSVFVLMYVMEDHNSGTTQLVVLPGPWISIPKNPSRQITSSDTTCALIDDMMAVPCPMYGRCKI